MPEVVNIAHKLSLFSELWSQKLIGQVNDMQIKLVKLQGEYIWHHHEQEDELFMVIKGRLCMKLRTGDQWIEEGEFIIVPHGVEHCPFAPDETHILLLEPATTTRGGNVQNDLTAENLQAL
ncbi:MAG: cupin domain-containing protein [Chloroflexota bacterium]|nr:cupin domain-containing protein [Chloroflexota bacterium]